DLSIEPAELADTAPDPSAHPAAPAAIAAGEIVARWTTPSDRGPAGTLGFFARVQVDPEAGEVNSKPREPMRFDWEAARAVPLDRVPLAVGALGAVGEVAGATSAAGVSMH